MIRVSTICGGLLVLLGIGVFGGLWASSGEKPSFTALIPAVAGVPVLLLAALALKPGMRKHAMHGVAVFALLGFVLSAGRLAMSLAKGGDFNLVAMGSLAGMAAISGYLLFACIGSFRQARLARQKEEAGE